MITQDVKRKTQKEYNLNKIIVLRLPFYVLRVIVLRFGILCYLFCHLNFLFLYNIIPISN